MKKLTNATSNEANMQTFAKKRLIVCRS